MAYKYIRRSLELVLKRAAAEFPAVVLTGPRQSSKTSLLKHLFGEDCRYLSLELPDIRAAAIEDPRGFLAMHPPPVIPAGRRSFAVSEFHQGIGRRSAQLFNLTDLSKDIGIAVNTAKAWLSPLEATYQVVLLRPYSAISRR